MRLNEIQELEEELVQAIVKSNVVMLDKPLHEDLVSLEEIKLFFIAVYSMRLDKLSCR